MTCLIEVSCLKLCHLIIYSDNLSTCFLDPGGMVCIHLDFLSHVREQLNAQTIPANQGKAVKAFCYFCSESLTHTSLSLSVTYSTFRPRFVLIISNKPTWELAARLGGNDVSLVREKRRGGQRNGHALGQSLQFDRARGAAAVTVLEASGALAAIPLQGAVGVQLAT